MAKLRGAKRRGSEKARARKKMKIVMAIFVLATVFNGGRMLFSVVAGPIGKAKVVEEFGGEERVAKLSEAELQAPYFAYINGKMDGAKMIIGKILGFFDNIGCLILLRKTAEWHWGVKATVWFTLGLFWEIVFALICLPLYIRWRKIVQAAATPKEEKTIVDPVQYIQKVQEAEVVNEVLDGVIDPNLLTVEGRKRVCQEILARRSEETAGD